MTLSPKARTCQQKVVPLNHRAAGGLQQGCSCFCCQLGKWNRSAGAHKGTTQAGISRNLYKLSDHLQLDSKLVKPRKKRT